MGNPLVTWLNILVVALMFFIGALILTVFFNVLPVNPMTSSIRLIYLSIFGFFDASFFFILIFIVLIDAVLAYFKPSKLKAVENILFVLFFGFIFLNVRGVILGATSVLPFNAIMPITYATLSSNWTAIFIFFALIMCAVFNFRKKEDEDRYDGEHG
jgi:hypothetical protein